MNGGVYQCGLDVMFRLQINIFCASLRRLYGILIEERWNIGSFSQKQNIRKYKVWHCYLYFVLEYCVTCLWGCVWSIPDALLYYCIWLSLSLIAGVNVECVIERTWLSVQLWLTVLNQEFFNIYRPRDVQLTQGPLL